MISGNAQRPPVLSIGRIYCDLIFTGLAALPEPGREVFAQDLKVAAGGGAFIAAAHLAHAGSRVALVARLGFDALSNGIEGELHTSGVDLRFLERSADAGPQVTVASMIGNDRAFLSRRAGTALPATLDAALEWAASGHLHIAEYATLHEIPDLVARAKARGLTTSLDPSWDETLIYDDDLLSRCAGVDLFLPNPEEATAITGMDDPIAAIELLGEVFPVVALKAGADGAWLKMFGTLLQRTSLKVPVVDTTGAGDAFNAGFIHAWLSGENAQTCLAAGVMFGSLAVQAAGGTAILHDPAQRLSR
jgi:sugar/nucleoside kinase (ribokinase family)